VSRGWPKSPCRPRRGWSATLSLILPISRSMVFMPYIHVLLAAFLMGLAAAAPIGPVTMMAIRHGVIGGWRHTLACGIGSVAGDLILFSVVLFGGHYLFSDLSNPTLRTALAAIGVIVLLPLGIYFLLRAVKEPLRAYASARQHWDENTVPSHLVAEVVQGTALTIFNPLAIVYWVGVTSKQDKKQKIGAGNFLPGRSDKRWLPFCLPTPLPPGRCFAALPSSGC
jgi:threonine/homoserine/homoserine lactone efflux protein